MNGDNVTEILMDIDGVLCDFVGAMCDAHGIENPWNDPRNHGRWDAFHDGTPSADDDKFWKPAGTVKFWSDMRQTADGEALMLAAQMAVGRKYVFLATTPTRSPASWQGKAEWVRKNMPDSEERLIMLRAKWLCASPTTLLIDDNDENYRAFRARGGQAILVPRLWNSLYPVADDAVGHVRRELNARL